MKKYINKKINLVIKMSLPTYTSHYINGLALANH